MPIAPKAVNTEVPDNINSIPNYGAASRMLCDSLVTLHNLNNHIGLQCTSDMS